ncbi:MAG: phosphoribosylformylglycinamidine synthase subunit PurL [Planctomycetes bacterium]|nr:phosphoribosylformylglycinamidine synthase subunit PurL [Planctomycetota bacterium]
MTLWEVDIHPATGRPNAAAASVAADAAELGIAKNLGVTAARGFLIQGRLSREQLGLLARELLADAVEERTVVAQINDQRLQRPYDSDTEGELIHVLPKPGVMDPVAESAVAAIADCLAANGLRQDDPQPQENGVSVRTLRKFWISGASAEQLDLLCKKVLANDAIEQVIRGPLTMERLEWGSTYDFQLLTVPIRDLDDAGLMHLSRDGQLYLTLVEMQTIQSHFRDLDRDPTDVELETLAQTWSEHCSHKTLAGRIAYRDERGERRFDNMLKETIFAATQEIRKQLGDRDWCVSVFKDNAGVVRFDDEFNVAFKVETHNHPSALEPYGGANTGIGGVIRDTLGTGMGAKPVCNTDVFCFAPPDTSVEDLPPGVLHPRRVMKGVVSGVRDYGNRMGIPTVNGAIYFDKRYLGNPLVYCGNVGILPRDKSFKQPQEGDYIVSIGGRTGRDGIHGATFSSAELTSDSETVSGGAVQIGNAITEKMVQDIILQARDRGLFTAITDCGAGGFSSAVGEMGEEIGAEVWLERAPLKYDGLSYTEIWISEAQERMVLSVPEQHWEEFSQLCSSEDVEATIIGRFVPTGRLQLKYHGQQVADLSMEFLHGGRPPIVRDAVYQPKPTSTIAIPESAKLDFTRILKDILGSLNVASKEWVIRQYDHEVQGGSVIKPLVGCDNDGPGDAAVLRPRLDSYRGLVVSCGMNPRYGDLDTYHMAASAIDEAVRNCVAVGADPSRIALLDNFCWGYTDRPETLGSLVRASLACHDMAVELGTPFISGKDSLNNEFSYVDDAGEKQTISIPATLLISALGQVADVRRCVTMDLKEPENLIYQVGVTKTEFGGSHFALVENLTGGQVPQVDFGIAKQTFAALYEAISKGLVRSCHDLSEGGLAVAAAEMAFAGGFGASLDLDRASSVIENPEDDRQLTAAILMFAESNSRFLCEVRPEHQTEFEKAMAAIPCERIGNVTESPRLRIVSGAGTPNESALIDVENGELKESWQAPLRW